MYKQSFKTFLSISYFTWTTKFEAVSKFQGYIQIKTFLNYKGLFF